MLVTTTRSVGLTVVFWAWAAAVGAAGDTQLADAAKRQNTAVVRALLKDKAVEVNGQQPDGATALLWAAQWDDVEMASLLVGAGADVNLANDYGVTPLMMAAENGSARMVTVLLTAGAHPDSALPNGETALMRAALTGDLDTVRALIARGASVNARESLRGQTALMWAVAERHRDVARVLLDSGADIRATSAKRAGYVVVGRSDQSPELMGGYAALHLAARDGDRELAQLLLDRGADLEATAANGQTPLLVATLRGQIDLATLLLERGADPNASQAGYTALHWAAGNWEHGTSIQYGKADEEWNVMGGLPRTKKLAMIETLLSHGAEVNSVTTKAPPGRTQLWVPNGISGRLTGTTPFWLAAMAADVEVMRLLLAWGADPAIAASDGSTPVAVASGTRYDFDTTVSEAQHLAAVTLAVLLGNDVNGPNGQGNTPLHIAAYSGYDSVITFLVAHGAQVNLENKSGDTPLQITEGVGTQSRKRSTAALLRSLGATDSGPRNGGSRRNRDQEGR